MRMPMPEAGVLGQPREHVREIVRIKRRANLSRKDQAVIPPRRTSRHLLHSLPSPMYSIGYVAGWSHMDTDLIKATAASVSHAAHQLAEAITETPQPTNA